MFHEIFWRYTKASQYVASVGRGIDLGRNLLLQDLVGRQVEGGEGNVPVGWGMLGHCDISFSPDKSRTQSPVKAGQAFSPEDLSKAGTKAEVGEPARFVPGEMVKGEEAYCGILVKLCA